MTDTVSSHWESRKRPSTAAIGTSCRRSAAVGTIDVVLARAVDWYAVDLGATLRAQSILRHRDVSAASIEKFGLGIAPASVGVRLRPTRADAGSRRAADRHRRWLLELVSNAAHGVGPRSARLGSGIWRAGDVWSAGRQNSEQPCFLLFRQRQAVVQPAPGGPGNAISV